MSPDAQKPTKQSSKAIRCPLGVYARVAELTGSGIKSAALTAAYRAAAEHRRIGNQDLIGAVDLEYRRIGRTGIDQELYTALYMEMGRGGSHA